MLLAQCCENDVVPFVLPFVEANIKDETWQRRDAAVMAFGKSSFHAVMLFQVESYSLLREMMIYSDQPI